MDFPTKRLLGAELELYIVSWKASNGGKVGIRDVGVMLVTVSFPILLDFHHLAGGEKLGNAPL